MGFSIFAFDNTAITHTIIPHIENLNAANIIISPMFFESMLNALYPIFTNGKSEPHRIIGIMGNTVYNIFFFIVLITFHFSFWSLLFNIFGSFYICLLLILAEVIPQHIPAANSDLQVFVFVGVFLRIS